MPSKKPARAGTLGYLGECGATIYIVCERCGRFTVAQLERLAQRVGWSAMAYDVGKRLRCSECGHRGAKFTSERPAVGRATCPRCLRPFGPAQRRQVR
jgi:hypothetical protein